MYKKKRYAKVAQLLKPSRTNKVQLLFAYNSLLVGKVVAIAKVTKFCHPYRVASGNFSLVSIAASLSSPAPTLIKLHSLLSLTGCPSAGIGLRLLAPWPPSSWSGSSRASSFGWPSDDSSAATTRWMRRSCWSHPAWPYWWMSCKYSRMFHPDMQIFDCWRSVRPVLFGPSVRRQSFPLFSPGQFSNCNCRNQLVPGMKHQMGQHGAHSECLPIPGQLLDSWMAFPYVSASCCRNFLHILATTFSASLEFLLVLFLAYFFSLLIWFFFFLYFSFCVNKSQKAASTRSLLVFVLASPKGGKFSRRDGVTCHRRWFR